MSVSPYQDIVFGEDGDIDPAGRERLLRLLRLDITDLVIFAHGWNRSPWDARTPHSAFFAPFPGLLSPQARVGYAGLIWPSMRFGDEPMPGTGPAPDGPEPLTELDAATRDSLNGLFPGHRATVARLARLLELRPGSADAFAEFGRLARRLTRAPAGGLENCFTADLPQDEQGPPALLHEDALTFCRTLGLALERSEPTAPAGPAGPTGPIGRRADPADGSLSRSWKGAKELLRQMTYYAMKRRAGAVGELGLGPLLGQLARVRPGTRIHLVGHSQSARLVSFALRGLPDGVHTVKSVTLLQGAFSHYAFAPSLPHAAQHAGALTAMEDRVDGPVVAGYSRHDTALGVLYPLASRLAGDDRSPGRPDRRWRALGHDGFQAVRPASARLTLDEALTRGVPRSGCVSVDTASVVRRGRPPMGAHNDICHPELARLVVSAGRVGR
ncbi:serine-threonine protein kinase [Streptomyces katsurahamanus]|uniref:Serine-threonine protein kinase n=2 Tax=Streptomyces katsurahamanus TaxID=2577098 RepID=A0ABW9NNI6_9ACTN|nr:serine-threonine protein kinase [Streptomyces katsurahamanus]MQS34479.1 serine-threonine protein kinase [Streptomyces katsurahamanus]